METRLEAKRHRTLRDFEDLLEIPMLVLSLAWIALLIVEFTSGLSPFLEALGLILWGIFLVEFGVRFSLAPQKGRFLLHNWLSAIALFIPALRLFRVFRAIRILRAARAVRGIRLVRVISTINRGIKAFGRALGSRGFGYVVLVTAVVVFVGAGGIFALEGDPTGREGPASYWEALWWSAMLITTAGTDFWPRSGEGRLLAFLMALYAFSVFGYIAGTLASYFIERKATDEDEGPTLANVHSEIKSLRKELADLRSQLPTSRIELR